MHALRLYNFAHMLPVSIGHGPISLCVSRVPGRAAVSGARQRLLLLHGNPANMHDFGPLAELLRDDLELLALDLPGFGWSDNAHTVGQETVLRTYARYVQAAVAQLGWTDRYYVLGHSHGGAVAQALAALFPEQVAGLVLLGSVGTPAHWGYRQLVVPGALTGLQWIARGLELRTPRRARRRIVRAIMQPIFHPYPLADAWVDEQLAVVDRRPEILVNMARVATGDPCGELSRLAARIRAPALFVHGDSDTLVPATHSRAVHDTIGLANRTEFHELKRTGHMLHMSHAPQIRTLLLDWLARHPG
jgi:pimeloyl-ACP methyl ester carboxylesterase